jgi:hypothetical protein
MITNAQFYFALSVPLAGILVNVVSISMLSRRVDRLEGRTHAGYDVTESATALGGKRLKGGETLAAKGRE